MSKLPEIRNKPGVIIKNKLRGFQIIMMLLYNDLSFAEYFEGNWVRLEAAEMRKRFRISRVGVKALLEAMVKRGYLDDLVIGGKYVRVRIAEPTKWAEISKCTKWDVDMPYHKSPQNPANADNYKQNTPAPCSGCTNQSCK